MIGFFFFSALWWISYFLGLFSAVSIYSLEWLQPMFNSFLGTVRGEFGMWGCASSSHRMLKGWLHCLLDVWCHSDSSSIVSELCDQPVTQANLIRGDWIADSGECLYSLVFEGKEPEILTEECWYLELGSSSLSGDCSLYLVVFCFLFLYKWPVL